MNVRLLATPATDLLHGLEAALGITPEAGDRGSGPSYGRLLPVFLGLGLGWWLYVPVHELLHALACLAAGGAVSELQISPLYGGGLLSRIFPFVTAGGAYAGRLSGFDTGGSDLVYLATVLGPYLLTLFPGVWLLRFAARRGRPLLFGASLPPALAPFLSLIGDAYELGSILLTRLGPWGHLATLLRGDDVARVMGEVAGAGGGLLAWCGLGLAFLLGAAWALLTYLAAAGLARALGQPSLG